MKMKNIISTLIIFVSIMSSFLILDMDVQASGMTLQQLQQKFPHGTYWNHAGSSENNPDGYTNTPCTHHYNCPYPYSGECGCNSFGSSIQCMGFANKCAYDIFGSLYTSWGTTNLDNLKAGDVIRYNAGSYNHSIFVTDVIGDTIIYGDCNSDSQCQIKWNSITSKTYIAPRLIEVYSSPYTLTKGNPPIGNVDNVTGGGNELSVRGWSFDKDDLGASLNIHVYIGGPAGSGAEGHVIMANQSRKDVADAYANLGVGEWHGFSEKIITWCTGVQEVYIYAINIGTGDNTILWNGTVTITKVESNKPTITNAKITDIGPLGYTVTVDVSDDSGISRVQFPSWTRTNDQDDLGEWVTDSKYSGTVVDGKVTYHVKTSKHNFESGVYATHIYAYDIYGNEAVLVMDDQSIPSIESGAQNIGEDFYAEIENCDSSLVLSTLSSEKKELTTESSKNVVVATNNDDEKQRWHFIRNSDGTYTIESCIEGYVLDVESASNTSSTNIGIYESNNTNAQKWYVLKNGNGYSFMPQCAMTMLLDVESNSHASGANVQTYDATYLNKAQVFNINEINLETTPAPTPELTPNPSPVVTPEFTPNPTPSVTPELTPNPTPTISGENGLLGDVNFDTKIDAPDALLVLKHAAKIIEFDEKQMSVADVTGDGQSDAKDALNILKFAAKIITEF